MTIKHYRVTLDIAVDLTQNDPPRYWNWAALLDVQEGEAVQLVDCVVNDPPEIEEE